MKIAVVGAGGVGGYIGALLVRSGHDVALIARNEHLEAIRAHGLRVRSVHGDFVARPTVATDRPEEVGPVDLVVFATKTYDTETAAGGTRPLVGPQTAVLSLQNGVESVARLQAAYGRGLVLGGAVWVVATVEAPGVLRQESQVRRVVLGEPGGRVSARTRAARDALASTGFVVEATDRIESVLWSKLLFIAPIGGLTALMRAPVGSILADPGAEDLLRRAMEEVEGVARARGIPLDGEIVKATMAFARNLEPTTTSSMQRDVEAGRRSEYDALSGAVVRAGAKARVPTPVHAWCWTSLRVMESARYQA